MAREAQNHLEMPARIVVAEDDRQMLLVVVEALRADGHDVEHVSDGEQLLVKLARQTNPKPFDLIVLAELSAVVARLVAASGAAT